MENQNWNTQIKKKTKNLVIWTMAWTASMALATFGPIFIWEGNISLTVIGIILNALLGIGMILSNIRYIKALDDLQRKIQLEAMGIALGVGIVGGLSYTLLDITNIISKDAEIGFLVILISLTYMIGLLTGQKRYK